jgi:hypothetical protein
MRRRRTSLLGGLLYPPQAGSDFLLPKQDYPQKLITITI